MSYKNSKNNIEKSIADDLDRFCPACEQFDNKFISRFKDNSDHWRTDMDPIFEELGMANYAIIKSLCTIKVALDSNSFNIDSKDANQTFKNAYFHFGLILDNVEHLARHIIRLRQRLEKENINPIRTKDELGPVFEKWLDNYGHHFDRYIVTGNFERPYSNVMPRFCELLLESDFYKEYNSFAYKLRDRRNTYAHNPSVGIFENDGKLWTVEVEALQKNRRWTEMKASFRNNRQYFVDPHEIARKDYEKTLTMLCKVWTDFAEHIERLFNNEDLKQLLPDKAH